MNQDGNSQTGRTAAHANSGHAIHETNDGDFDRVWDLSRNLWWAWHPDAVRFFRELDPIRWRRLGHNPIALLAEFTTEQFDRRVRELALSSQISYAYRQLREYLRSNSDWGHIRAGVLRVRPVAYFSPEFGVHESLPLCVGGLGIQAGDHVKCASDLGVGLVGVGLFYHDSDVQRLDHAGLEQAFHPGDMDLSKLPLLPAVCRDGKSIQVEVETPEGAIAARVWKLIVGRATVLLLDADLEANGTADRTLTARPYCGDTRLRLRQSMLLGIGGARALAALGIRPSVFHLNDPASAVAVLEVVRQRMAAAETSFDEAVRYVAGQTVFTIHTAAATCHDQFEAGLAERQLGSLANALGMSAQQLAGLGRFDQRDSAEPFCCAVLGLRLSRWANGVSALHGRMARQRWNRLWPGRIEQEVPIGHVTSGVHFPSWLAPQMQELYDRHLERNWHQHSGEPETWAAIEQIDNGELWETHQVLKARLLQFVRRRLARRCVRLDDPPELQLSARQMLHPDVLTIGFAHRYAQFKRPTLVKRHLERLIALCHDQERPVQWVFAGKPDAHDAQSRDLVREIACLAEDPRLAGRLVFVEDYDMNVSRHLVQGVDVWLNTSRTPCEATGTSGQKVVLNGGLNLSTLDGWWSEAYDGINGFAIGTGETHSSPDVQDQRDADELFHTLEQQVVPLYYERDADGLPRGWLARVKWAIRTLGWRFNAERMLRDYVERCYLPAAAGLSCDMNDHAAPARRW